MKRAILLAVAAALAAPAATMSARTTPALFDATLKGTITRSWSYRDPGVVDGECHVLLLEDGERTVSFHSRRPTLVALRPGGGRGRIRFVGGIASGASSTTEDRSDSSCSGGSVQRGDCLGPAARFIAAASFTASASRLRFGALAGQPPVTGACGTAEPARIAAVLPLGLQSAAGNLSSRDVLDSHLGRLIVRTAYTTTTRLTGDATGQVRQRVVWTLTLTRLRRR